jgi:dipeptidyl aminopeptidase/acylaminoacyl peptidase
MVWLKAWVMAALLLPVHAMAQEAVLQHFGSAEVMQYKVTQRDGPTVEYFLSKPKQRAPLVLFIEGSGCRPAFVPGKRMSFVFNFVPMAQEGKYAVMVANKPFSPAEPPAGQPGVATACPDAFNNYFTLVHWVRDLRLVLDHALQQPWVDPQHVLVMGTSEGAAVAAALAEADPRVRNVAMLGGSGTTQYYDFVVAAYRNGHNDPEIKQQLDELDATRQQILAKPDSVQDIAWGHPYKRWSGFFRASPAQQLLRSSARVYIVSGMQDVNVPILSAEVLGAELMAAGHDVTMRRVPNADHGLMTPDGGWQQRDAEYRRILDWFERSFM